MIKELVERWEQNKSKIKDAFKAKHPDNYTEIVELVVSNITSEDDWGDEALDHERIHVIDDGHYQGTLVYIIAAKGYQPSTYWYVKVGYGSCSGCDTLEGIRNYDDEAPSEQQVKDYMTLALHIVQGIKKMGDEEF